MVEPAPARRPRPLDLLVATRTWAENAGFTPDAVALLSLAVAEVRNGGSDASLRAALMALREHAAQGSDEAVERERWMLEDEKRAFSEYMHNEQEELEAAENAFDEFLCSHSYYPAEEGDFPIVADKKREERAVFQRWMDECADLGPSKGPTEFRALHESYATWAKQRGEFRYSYRKLGEYLNFRDIPEDPNCATARQRLGIALRRPAR
jgi:hypothetical protein